LEGMGGHIGAPPCSSEPGQPVVDDVTQVRRARLRELVARSDHRLVDGDQSPEIDRGGGDDDVRTHTVEGGAERLELDPVVADSGQDGSDVRIRPAAPRMMIRSRAIISSAVPYGGRSES